MTDKNAEITNNESLQTVWISVTDQAQKRRPFQSIFMLFGCLVVLTGVVVAFTAVTGFLLYSQAFILPGVRVLDQTLAWQSPAAAAVQLQTFWETQTVTLTTDNETWTLAPAELGLVFDAQGTVQTALDYGRSPQTLSTLFKGQRDVPPVWTWDQNQAAAALTNLAGSIDRLPQDANIQVVGGVVQPIAAQNGRRLDVDTTLAAVNPTQLLQTRTLPLAVEPLLPTITDVSDTISAIEGLLTNSIQIQVVDPVRDETQTWTLTPDIWNKWVSVQHAPEQPAGFTWTLQADLVAGFIDQQALSLGTDRYVDAAEVATAVAEGLRGGETAVMARIYHHPHEHIVQSGESMALIGYNYGIPYPWIQQANPDVTSLIPGQAIIIPSPDEMLPLPPVADKRVIVSISEQRTRVYENGALKWDWPASTGINDSPTAPGIFQIQSHDPNAYASNWDLEMPNFMGIYRPVPTSDFMNGFHGFPTRGGSQLLWTGDLGHKVTYGCVLLSSENASILYDWAEEGVVVEIKP